MAARVIAPLRPDCESPRTTLESAREVIDNARAVYIVMLPKEGDFIAREWISAENFQDLAAMSACAWDAVRRKLAGDLA